MIVELVVSRQLVDRLYREARSGAPHEIVGILAGRADGHVTDVFPLPNTAGPGGHVADPRAQYAAERAIRARNLVWLAVYHSHPGGGTEPSPLDIAFASRRPTIAHVIVAVDRTRQPDAITAFRVEGQEVTSVDLVIARPSRSENWLDVQPVP